MSDEPSVLGMINKNLDTISGDVKDIKQEMKNGAVKMENHEGRLKNVEKDTKELKGNFRTHVTNKEKHYNPHYSESFGQKVRRKKGEIGVASAGGGLIGLLIFLIEKYM